MRNSKTELVLHPNHNISKCLVLEEVPKKHTTAVYAGINTNDRNFSTR